MEVTEADIQNLRTAFFNKLSDVGQSETDLFHPNDINRIKVNGAWLRRFLLHQDNDQALALNMLWEACEWRKSFGTNDLSEGTINMSIVQDGSIFPRNRDKDGRPLLIFKSKKHVKGKHDFQELKRVLIYWMERLDRAENGRRISLFFDAEGTTWGNMDFEVLAFMCEAFQTRYPAFLNYIFVFEQPWILNGITKIVSGVGSMLCKQENGEPISIFFDMDGAGLSNMDMEYTKYIISLFKLYYPFFLNNIYIFEMAWVLNAAFKVIKTWLPPKAVEKIKFITKSNLKEYVPPEQSLKSWGGQDDYVFEFTPEVKTEPVDSERKKVHFADNTPVIEITKNYNDVADSSPSHKLTINPADVIQFVPDSGDTNATLRLKNDETVPLSFKIKTTAPEKFRVRPSAGLLNPGTSTSISVQLLPGYDGSGLQRDKFLVLSVPVTPEFDNLNPAELWKAASKDVVQHRLRCLVPTAANVDAVRHGSAPDGDRQITKLSNEMSNLREGIQNDLRLVKIQLWILILAVACLVLVLLFSNPKEVYISASGQSCQDPAAEQIMSFVASPSRGKD